MGRQTTGLEPSLLVRYRFDTPVQLRRHLHAANVERRYLFLRDPGPQFATGARIVLEVSFHAHPQRYVLHGMVRWHDQGSRAATWLEVAEADLHHRRCPASWRQRTARRLPADLIAEIRPAHAPPFVGRILDLAEHGARVFAGGHELGDGPLSMTFLPSERRLPLVETMGHLVWSHAPEAGIAMPGDADVSHRRLLYSLEQAWRDAVSLAHPRACECGKGGLPDELLGISASPPVL